MICIRLSRCPEVAYVPLVLPALLVAAMLNLACNGTTELSFVQSEKPSDPLTSVLAPTTTAVVAPLTSPQVIADELLAMSTSRPPLIDGSPTAGLDPLLPTPPSMNARMSQPGTARADVEVSISAHAQHSPSMPESSQEYRAVTTPALTRLTAEVVVVGLERPVFVGHAGDGSGRLFVVEKAGRIRIIAEGTLVPDLFLDITELVDSGANERGLLGLAFHPEYASNGRFFVHYTGLNEMSVLAEYRVSRDADRADPASAEILLTETQPFGNHNGGMIAFGPDDMLYVALGDGGSANDPRGNGQDLDTLLGKLLRLDVSQSGTYVLPPDNPFYGVANARAEIWAYGLRNSWRFSFDRTTGDLYLADVGQDRFEEIDFAEASSTGGENYGWNILEGRQCFRGTAADCASGELIPPVAVYGHESGCSVTGGYVYRGSVHPALVGTYVFGDYCSGFLWTLRRDAARDWQMTRAGEVDARISSFGEDEAGEIYLTDDSGGRVLRLRALI